MSMPREYLDYIYVTPCGDVVEVLFGIHDDGLVACQTALNPGETIEVGAVFPFLENAHSSRDVIAGLLGREGWCRLIPEAILN